MPICSLVESGADTARLSFHVAAIVVWVTHAKPAKTAKALANLILILHLR
jgi:hypothetical protein